MKLILPLLLSLLLSPATLLQAAPTPATGPVALKITWVDPDTRAVGFKLFWGTGNGTYESSADIGFPTIKPYVRTITMPGKPRICFSIAAYNFVGEADKSDDYCQDIPMKRILLRVVIDPVPIIPP